MPLTDSFASGLAIEAPASVNTSLPNKTEPSTTPSVPAQTLPSPAFTEPALTPTERPQLGRSSIEAYIFFILCGAAATMAAWNIPVNFWVGCVLAIAVALCAADLLWKSPFTLTWNLPSKTVGTLIISLLLVLAVNHGYRTTHVRPSIDDASAMSNLASAVGALKLEVEKRLTPPRSAPLVPAVEKVHTEALVPDIKPAILQATFIDDPDHSGVKIIARANFANNGTPGTVHRLLLDAVVDGKPITGTYVAEPRPGVAFNIHDEVSGEAQYLLGNEYWSYTVGSNPIAQNTSAFGWTVSEFSGLTTDELVARHAVLILRCYDTREHMRSATHQVGQKPGLPPILGDGGGS